MSYFVRSSLSRRCLDAKIERLCSTCNWQNSNLLIRICNNLQYVRLKSKYMSVWEGSFVVVEFCVKGARQGRSTLWHGGAGDRGEDWANVKLCSDINLKRDLSPGITFHYSWNLLNFPKARLMLVSASGDLFSLVVLSNSFNNPSLFFWQMLLRNLVASQLRQIVRDKRSIYLQRFFFQKRLEVNATEFHQPV